MLITSRPFSMFWIALAYLCLPTEADKNGKNFGITKLDVPMHVKIHDDAELNCEHNYGPRKFATLTWLHNDKDFYRYTPKDSEPKFIFNGSSVTVDLKSSTDTKVVLKNVSLSATGLYKCMVLGEAPMFERSTKEASLTVVVIPNSKPLIEPPLGDSLRPGSLVDLNCTAFPSIPAATLEWKVNGKPAKEDDLEQYPVSKNEEGLFVTKLGLRFKVEKSHFVNSTLNLKCISNIATLYDKSDEHSHQLPPGAHSQTEPPAQPAIEGNLVKKSNDGENFSASTGLLMGAMCLAYLR